jgi:hypothetical protein
MDKLIATVAGIAAMIATIMLIEGVAHAAFPTPPVAGAEMARIIAMMPAAAKVLVVLGWFAGPLAGAALAARLTPWRPAPWIVAGLALAGGVATVVMIPHPPAMSIAAVAGPLLALWSGVRLGSRTRAAP